jgi:hypothetical protein
MRDMAALREQDRFWDRFSKIAPQLIIDNKQFQLSLVAYPVRHKQPNFIQLS